MQWKTWTGAVAVAAVVSVAGVFAQAPSSSASSSQRAGDPSAAGTITVTGCLSKGDQMSSSTATTGTTGTRGSESASYMLKESAPASATGSTGTTGTTGSSASYMLEGHESDLASHVNEQVEVKGTIASGSAASRATSSASAMPSSNRTLQVDSVRMVASSCSK
ncbi:MAG TPA: hypothetical protein VHZ73_04725 [Vicinamibacterales bacterium]|jgi:UDP-N-acetylmuramyl tripeptide synthase|nr:hypothetical protein [Vicinamibacterales bacterium]